MIEPMNATLKNLPIAERIQLVEDLWDSIAHDQSALPVTAEQTAELDRRLDRYEADPDSGRNADEILREIRSRL
jgi:putative addiction module component (TIGR02574 family)